MTKCVFLLILASLPFSFALLAQEEHPYRADYMTTNRDEAHAWLVFAEGKNDQALSLLRSVADKQDAVGKGEVELPAREMLGDMLLEMSRSREALREYEKSLKTDPNRFNGLYGAARSAELLREPRRDALATPRTVTRQRTAR
jgi:tetratricopeptide (TPR) repeat protein